MGKTSKKPTNTHAILQKLEQLLANMQEGEAYELALSLDDSGQIALRLKDSGRMEKANMKREYGKFKGEIKLCSSETESKFDQELEGLFYGESE